MRLLFSTTAFSLESFFDFLPLSSIIGGSNLSFLFLPLEEADRERELDSDRRLHLFRLFLLRLLLFLLLLRCLPGLLDRLVLFKLRLRVLDRDLNGLLGEKERRPCLRSRLDLGDLKVYR